MRHGTLFIPVEPLLLLLIAVPQENGVIHGNTQLKDCRQRLCHIGYLTFEYVGSQIVHDCHSDAEQKQDRNKRGVHGQ